MIGKMAPVPDFKIDTLCFSRHSLYDKILKNLSVYIICKRISRILLGPKGPFKSPKKIHKGRKSLNLGPLEGCGSNFCWK